ncbi:MAG: PQQ-binding-like beta-propeller repeat protein [Acidobacteria bacterium]|nr:PQQ-binding-like beta-propeller repeat protein [Acidobacteriota bacterium]
MADTRTRSYLRRRLLGAAGIAALAAALVAPVLGQQGRREWRDYAGGPDSSRFMPLEQITKANVGRLDVAWAYPHAETLFNPIVARGIIYTRARNSSLVALDAATGKELWIHDGLQGMTTRGINYWESRDGRDRRLIFSINDYLQEIDARTGKSIRTFGTDGVVDLREGLDRDPTTVGRIQSGTPGRVFENLILLGSATGEGYFSPPGDVRAYDVVTGRKVWQFHTVPRPGEFGYETWPKDAWKYIGGTNTWGELSIDAARGIAYFPTGSPTFDYYGADRVGQNLFANCLIALDARTGKRLWHFQNVHHDLWDFDNVSAPQLTTIRKDGRSIDVVAMAGKTGYLYVFDRVTGAPIWPIEEKPVPTKTDVPGEVLWPTQPIPTTPPPFGRQTFTADDINPHVLTPAEREQYRERVRKARNDGPFTPIGFSEVIHMPGNHGGSNFGSTSANPNDGTVYVTNYNVPAIMRLLRPGEEPPMRGGGAGPAAGPGLAVYQQNCQVCHGPDRAGVAAIPPLVGITSRLSQAELRNTIQNGRGQMPPFHQLSATDLDALLAFLTTADSGRGGGAGFGRSAGPAPSFPPGPTVESGPARVREGGRAGGGFSLSGAGGYPPDVDAPENRLVMESYGLYPDIISPPYTTLTAYDLNKGTIKWQIGLGDDLRLVSQGITGTGSAQGILVKGSVIPTATGLLFVNTTDRKLRVYDADTGKPLWEFSLGAYSSGSPSMFELNGRQYVLVTASEAGMRGAGAPDPRIPPAKGPTGLIALALPGK